MATKKTNNEENSKRTSAPKKSAESSKTSKKQSTNLKKKTDSQIKKSAPKKTTESKTVKKGSEIPKKTVSSSIRKIEPIKTDDIEKKEERESIKLLREAIKAKSKNISKPVAVRKHLIVKDEEIKENETVSNTAESSIINKEDAKDIKKADFLFNEFKKKEENKTETQTFSKNIYSKSDIFKKPVTVKSPIEEEELKKNIESSKFNQIEIDKAIENAAIIEDNTPIEDYSIYSSKKLEELKRKDIKIIETEDEMKGSGILEIEKKPVQPYTVPPHSSVKKEKKSNKLVAVIGIIIIILGLSYLGFQFFGNKADDSENDFYSSISTNESDTNNIISPTTNDNTEATDETENITNEISMTNNIDNIVIEQNSNTNTTAETNDIKAVSSNNTVIQSNIVVSPQPNLPNTPTIPSPPIIPNPPARDTNAYLGGNIYKTKWNDTLTSIASSELGDARRWPTIYVMNENIFKDPDSFVFNKNIILPEGAKKKVDDMNAEEKRALYNDYMRVSEAYLNIGKTNLANIIKSRANSIIK